MKYIMIIAGNTEHSSDGVAAPDALAYMQREIPKWIEEVDARGVRLFGRELDLPNTAATVRVRNGETQCDRAVPMAVTAASCDTSLAPRLKQLEVRRLVLRPFKVKGVPDAIVALRPAPSEPPKPA